jgi:hypothetical protein
MLSNKKNDQRLKSQDMATFKEVVNKIIKGSFTRPIKIIGFQTQLCLNFKFSR